MMLLKFELERKHQWIVKRGGVTIARIRMKAESSTLTTVRPLALDEVEMVASIMETIGTDL